MRQAYQFRSPSTDHGTFSQFFMPSINWKSFVAEPPWRDNKNSISCIPAGDYIVVPRKSPKYGWTFHITDVNNRKYILLHSGNYSGDVQKGLKSHTMGCNLHGQKLGYLRGQKVVLNSRMTINALMKKTNLEPFKLKILWL